MTKKLLTLCLGFILFDANAQTKPPVAPPLSLPPLPQYIPKNLPPLPENPDRSPLLPETGENTKGDTNSEKPDVAVETKKDPNEYSKAGMLNSLVAEASRMEEALAGRMRFWFNTQDSTAFRDLKIQGKFSPDLTTRDDHFGFVVYFQPQNPLNTLQEATCMVAFDQAKSPQIFEAFVEPSQGVSNPQTAYAFAIAHATAHCLDQEDRFRLLNKRLSWNADDTGSVGILPDVARKVYGNEFSKDAYWTKPKAIATENQVVYEERAADAFATGWALKIGATDKGIDALSRSLGTTKVAIDFVKDEKGDIGRARDVGTLWDMARSVQQKTWTGNAVADIRGVAQNSGGIVRYLVTAQGLVGVDKDGNPVADEQGKTTQAPAIQNFNTLPRFGSSRSF